MLDENEPPRRIPALWWYYSEVSVAANAYRHWKKHRREFPSLQNAVQYARAARGFIERPPSDVWIYAEPDGTGVAYSKRHNLLAMFGPCGTPKTFFAPEVFPGANPNFWRHRLKRARRNRNGRPVYVAKAVKRVPLHQQLVGMPLTSP